MRLLNEAPNARRVLILLPSLAGGGTERVMLTLLRHLDRRRMEPRLVLLQESGALVGEVPADVPVHNLNASRVRYALPALVRLVRRLRPISVLSNMPEPNQMLMLCRPLLPRSVRLCLRESMAPGSWLAGSRNPRLRAALGARLYPHADGVVCQCESMAAELENLYSVPRKKMMRIYNPVDRENIRRLADSVPNPFANGGCSHSSNRGPNLVAAGRLVHVKGFDLLLRALPAVTSEFPGVNVTILGEGPLQAELRELARTLGVGPRVRFAGFQLNPFPWMKHADLLVLPSRYDGLPNVMLEALALGTPVVAADCPGGVREILDRCPIGRIAPPGDPVALARTIVETLRARLKPTEGDLQRFLEPFRVERIVRQYEELLAG